MANTDKQNFRCDGEAWRQFREHVEAMRARGYEVDMSMILRAEVERTINETLDQTARRLDEVRLMRGEDPAPANETSAQTSRRLRRLATS